MKGFWWKSSNFCSKDENDNIFVSEGDTWGVDSDAFITRDTVSDGNPSTP